MEQTTRLPSKIESELNSEFRFTHEFNNEVGLLHIWNHGRYFVNPTPPYRNGSVELYVNKALRSKAELVVLLIPCDVSTTWFNRIWELNKQNPNHVELRFFKGRIKYEGDKDSRFQFRVPS